MRGERMAKNEALFRAVNERVKDVSRPFEEVVENLAAAPVNFVCECGLDGCLDMIPLTVTEYEAVRAHPARFAIVPGHEVPSIERVVSEHDGYAVVEKHADEAGIALATDPRS